MANKPISTSPTTMGKHGRLREEEAARDKGVKFGEIKAKPEADKTPAAGSFAAPDPRKAEQEAQKNREMRAAFDRVAAQKPVEKAPETLVGPMLLSDVQAALSDRYPHNDIHELEGATIEVAVPGGVILVDFKAVNKCKNTAELRAYIDALPIQ